MSVRLRLLMMNVMSGSCVAAGVLVGGLLVPGLAAGAPPDRVSIRSDGAQSNGPSSGAATSGDGECVAFYSDASNLIPQALGGDTNQVRDVFVFDRRTRLSQRVSVSTEGVQGNGPSQAQGFLPAINETCSCVAFSSDASNLVAGDTNGASDVFVRDLTTPPTTSRVSVGEGGQSNGTSSFPSVSADCRFVAFQSTGSNLVAGDTNNASDIFVRDRLAGTTVRVSVGAGGQANGRSITPAMSADGRCVAFATAATNLLGPDTNGRLDVYVACDGAVTCRASVSSAGEQANDDSFLPSLSANGRLVAFKSLASNLVPNDSNGAADVFVHDCQAGTTELISVSTRGEIGDDNSFPPSISGDGRFVAFGSFSSNLAQGMNTRGKSQIYVRDRQAGTTLLISQTPFGNPGNGSAPDIPPSISLSGDFVAFASFASDLSAGDTNETSDAFLGENATATPTRTPTPIACEDTEDCPRGQVCVGGICQVPTATPTSTPTIACDDNGDCPAGQVCSGGICRFPTPTATPTPPIACFIDLDCPVDYVCIDGICRIVRCSEDADCPGGRTCKDGVCQPIPITPSPLPTCMEDADCPEPDRCRAMVCVPPRPCDDNDPELDRVNCRGERETCVGGACECGGDCNLDGIVFGNEISIGVGILGGVTPLSQCPAADIVLPLDNEVMGNEITLAVLNLGYGCPGEGLPLVFGGRADQVRTIEIGAGTGSVGGTAAVTVSLTGGGDVATAQLDILFNSAVFSLDNPEAACSLSSRLRGTHELRAFRPQRPATQPGISRVRFFVGDLLFPVESFTEGPLFTCNFEIDASAVPGNFVVVGERVNIGDVNGDVFDGRVTDGSITVTECDGDDDCPENRVCRNGVCRFTCETTEDCPEGLECVEGVCLPPQPTPTVTPTLTVSRTPTNTPAATNTVTRTRTPAATVTVTNTPEPTTTATRTRTQTHTFTTTPTSKKKGGGGGCALQSPRVDPGAIVTMLLPALLLFRRRR